MKIYGTATAVNNLQAIYDYIAQNSLQYAERTIDRLTRRSQQIAEFPLSGRIVPEFEQRDIREIIEGPYRIIYLVKTEQIDILAVVHGSRQISLPKLFPESS